MDLKNFFYNIKINRENNFFSFLFFLLPPALITGPFLSDLIITILAFYYLYVSFKKKQLLYFNFNFVKFFLLFYIILIISSFNSENVFYSLKSSFFYIRFLLFSLAIVYLSSLNKNFYKNFFYSLFLVFFILCVDSLYQILFKKNLLGFPIYEGVDAVTQKISFRISSLFGKELILGSYISRLLFIFVGLYFYLNIKQKFFLPMVLLLVAITFYSGERIAVFTLFFCIIYNLILNIQIRKKIVSIIFLFVPFLFILFYFNSSVKNRMFDSAFFFLQNNKTKNEYISPEKFIFFTPDHHELYIASYKMFLDKPIFGHGHKSFRFVCKKDNYNRSVSSCSTHSHSILFQFLAEKGIIGFLFLLTIYLFLVKKFFQFFNCKIKDKSGSILNFKICLFSIITANFFPFFPSGNFFNNWISIVYFLPISIYLSLIINKKNLS